MGQHILGVIADTHYPEVPGPLPLQAMRLHWRGVDRILHAGDMVSGDLLRMLETIAPVDAVAGNMDPFEVAHLLPEKTVIVVDDIRIGLVHGAIALPPEDKCRYYFGKEKLDVFVFGHTHIPFNERIDGVLFFNPGSPTKPKGGRPPSLGILHIAQGVATGTILRLGTDREKNLANQRKIE